LFSETPKNYKQNKSPKTYKQNQPPKKKKKTQPQAISPHTSNTQLETLQYFYYPFSQSKQNAFLKRESRGIKGTKLHQKDGGFGQ
jgi:hypothetical protein